MKKLILVDVPDGYYVGTINLIPNDKNSSKWAINQDCKDVTFTAEEISYLITLCNSNENGELYAYPCAEEVERKLRELK